jgi:hypothetical protein
VIVVKAMPAALPSLRDVEPVIVNLELEDEGEMVAEANLASATRMLESSTDVVAQLLERARQISDELARPWF